MCTVSWLRCRGGYELFCNRDERNTRTHALAPATHTSGSLRYIAPTDMDFGGSWIAANEAGLSLCILNRYHDEASSKPALAEPEREFESRGLLLTRLIHSRSAKEAMRGIESAPLSRYRPFTMLAITPDAMPLLANWTGRQLLFEAADDALLPLTSSSYATTEVTKMRRNLFRQLAAESNAINAEMLLDFHRSHAPERGAFSVCMHRSDAATVSFSRVSVNERSVEFFYQPGALCSGVRATTIFIKREREVMRRRTAEGSETWHCRLL